MTHDDALLEMVLEQIQQDVNDGDVTALFDMLGYIPKDALICYLSMSRQEEGVSKGLFTDDDVHHSLNGGQL